MISKTKDAIKISSLINIPKGMYFVPSVHRGLLAYRTLLGIEKNNSPEAAIDFAKSFVLNSKDSDKEMIKIYKRALIQYSRLTKDKKEDK